MRARRSASMARPDGPGKTQRIAAASALAQELAKRGDEVPLRNDAYYLINPGSVGQSRTADPRASFLILATVRQVVTVHRVSYDTAAALAKTRRGLLHL